MVRIFRVLTVQEAPIDGRWLRSIIPRCVYSIMEIEVGESNHESLAKDNSLLRGCRNSRYTMVHESARKDISLIKELKDCKVLRTFNQFLGPAI